MRILLFLLVAMALGACATEPTGMPAPVVSETEIEELESAAAAFGIEHFAAWPDVSAYVADFAEDVHYFDPTWGDQISGRDKVTALLTMWEDFTNYTIDAHGMYISTDGAAYEMSWPNLQPPIPLPPDPPLASGMEIYRFHDGEVVAEEMWFRSSDNEFYGIACYAVDGCPAVDETVDRYLAAWTAHDPDAIAALYSDDATFTDSLLGLEAEGGAAIGALADQRFGSSEDLAIEVLDLYVWTDGYAPPTEASPDMGKLIGVALHYRAEVDSDGTAEVHEGLTTLELATRDEENLEADPQGLIHREEVYHDATTLMEAAESS